MKPITSGGTPSLEASPEAPQTSSCAPARGTDQADPGANHLGPQRVLGDAVHILGDHIGQHIDLAGQGGPQQQPRHHDNDPTGDTTRGNNAHTRLPVDSEQRLPTRLPGAPPAA
jgi:hypothetical protein